MCGSRVLSLRRERMWRARLSIVAILAAVASGCTDGGERDGTASPPDASTTRDGREAPTVPPPWSMADARVDRIPDGPPRQESSLPAAFPADNSVLPNLLRNPPGRARLAYHPRESLNADATWESERVFFLGVDDVWRSLEMSDLGLPASTHPGSDTYGAGELSPDGSTWAARTRAGIVLLDLSTGRSRIARLPGNHTSYLAWRSDGQSLDAMRLHGAGAAQRTWTVDPRTLDTERAPYLMPIDGFANDGSVVTFAQRGADTHRIVHRGGSKESDVVAVPYRLARRGGVVGPRHTLFGLNRDIVAVRSDSLAPVARLRLDPSDATGWPRGWWNRDTLWCYEAQRGLITWNVSNGRVRVLTRVRPAAEPDTYWSASVAVDLMR